MLQRRKWVWMCLALLLCAGLLLGGCGNSGQQAQGEILDEPLPTELVDPEDPEVEDPAADVEVPTPIDVYKRQGHPRIWISDVLKS